MSLIEGPRIIEGKPFRSDLLNMGYKMDTYLK